MFNRNKFTDNELRELERYEEYERRKNERIAKGVGNFFYRYIIKSFIWIALVMLFQMSFNHILSIHIFISTILAMIISLVLVFKLKYISENLFRSLIVIIFLNFLLFMAFEIDEVLK